MINITIKNDNFAYLVTDSENVLDLLKRSFTREEREFNNFYRMWETRVKTFYKMFQKENGIIELQIKAGLVPYLCRSLKERNFNYIVENERKCIKGEITKVETQLDDEIKLRPEQEQASLAALKYGFGCIQFPTGAGKTEVSASIIKTYLKHYSDEAFLYVVPTIMLKKEARERFEKYGIAVNDDFPIKNNCVNIITYMALNRADNDKFGYKERDKITAIIWDEAHRLAADKTQKLIHKFKQLRMSIGMSATPSQDAKTKLYLKDLNSKDMAVFGCTGRILFRMGIDETIERKFVTGIEVHVIKHKTEHQLFDDENDWHIVKNTILKDKKRAEFVAQYVKQFFTEHNMHTALCYIPEIEWSQIYMKEVADQFKDTDVRIFELYGGGVVYEHKNGEFVRLTKQEAEDAIQAIRSKNVKTIFSGTSFIREGINITSIQALFNIGGNKGSILIKQIVGRAMRNFEGKNLAYICEIEDINNPILQSQWRKKLEIYTQEYNAKIIYDTLTGS